MQFKKMLMIAAAVPMIFLVAFLVVPEFFVLGSYPNAEGLALEIGITHRYIMAGMLYIVVSVLFQTREVEDVHSQRKIILGVAVGFAVMCAAIILLGGSGRGLPLIVPPVIATGTIAILSFWSRSKLS